MKKIYVLFMSSLLLLSCAKDDVSKPSEWPEWPTPSKPKINTWREDKFERSVANGTETVFVTLRFCVVRKQLKATLKPNAAGVQLPPHYYRNG